MLTIIIDPKFLGDADFLAKELGEITDYVKSARPAQGVDEVLVPGDPERISVVNRGRDGIQLDDSTWGQLLESARSVGISHEMASKMTEVLRTSSD